ncbi:MAG: hypothetical protein ACJAX1_001930 [Neolewinella sp.]|jgi:hypothetical protein
MVTMSTCCTGGICWLGTDFSKDHFFNFKYGVSFLDGIDLEIVLKVGKY